MWRQRQVEMEVEEGMCFHLKKGGAIVHLDSEEENVRQASSGDVESRGTDLQVEGSSGQKLILKRPKKDGAMTVPDGASCGGK